MGNELDPCEGRRDEDICRELVRIFGAPSVKPQWNVCTGASDHLRRTGRAQERYCPIPDFAVGPFNRSIHQADIDRTNDKYEELEDLHQQLLSNLNDLDLQCEQEEVNNASRNDWERENWLSILSRERASSLIPNENPRCFLAIEIERATSEKHVLGGIVTASGLGRMGIIITRNTDRRYRSAMRIRRYLRFLVAVGKTGDPSKVTLGKNTIVLRKPDFLRVLRTYQPTRVSQMTRNYE